MMIRSLPHVKQTSVRYFRQQLETTRVMLVVVGPEWLRLVTPAEAESLQQVRDWLNRASP